MPRKARIDAPGALHHIIIRGIERKAIFKDNADRANFLERLGRIIPDTETGCYAWVLMRNHVHLLLKTGLAPIATVMRRLLTGYAVSFNRKHRRHGQLFQNRYKSFLCEEDVYLKELVRYLHLTPIRAKMVKGVRELLEARTQLDNLLTYMDGKSGAEDLISSLINDEGLMQTLASAPKPGEDAADESQDEKTSEGEE